MRDLCGTCENIKNFAACAVSRSFCRLAANPEFLGCGLLCAPKSCKEFDSWELDRIEFVWPYRGLPETGHCTLLNDLILFGSCHRTSCKHNLNLHTTTIADHWHVVGSSGKGEHVLKSSVTLSTPNLLNTRARATNLQSCSSASHQRPLVREVKVNCDKSKLIEVVKATLLSQYFSNHTITRLWII